MKMLACIPVAAVCFVASAPSLTAALHAEAGSLFVGRGNLTGWNGISMRAEVAAKTAGPFISYDTNASVQIHQEQVAPGGVVPYQTISVIGEATRIPEMGLPKDQAYVFGNFEYTIGDAETPDSITFRLGASISAYEAYDFDSGGTLVPVDLEASASLYMSTSFVDYPISFKVTLTVLDSAGEFIPELGGYWNAEDVVNSTSNPDNGILIDFDAGLQYIIELKYTMHVDHGTDPVQNVTLNAGAGTIPIPEPAVNAMAGLVIGGWALLRRRKK
jgi:hypothetical protein